MLFIATATAYSWSPIAASLFALLPFLFGFEVASFAEDEEVEGTTAARFAFSLPTLTSGMYYLNTVTPGVTTESGGFLTRESEFDATWSANEDLIDNLEKGNVALFYEYNDSADDWTTAIKEYNVITDDTAHPAFAITDDPSFILGASSVFYEDSTIDSWYLEYNSYEVDKLSARFGGDVDVNSLSEATDYVDSYVDDIVAQSLASSIDTSYTFDTIRYFPSGITTAIGGSDTSEATIGSISSTELYHD